MMDDTALLLAVVGLVPLTICVIYSDLKYLKIPNWVSISVVCLFVATGSWGLPLETFLWRLAHGAIAFGLGYVVYRLAEGSVGAGDVKLIAAFTPFVPGSHLVMILVGFVITSFVVSVTFLIVRKALKEKATGWKSFEQGAFIPAGMILGITILIFLTVQISGQFGVT